MSGMSTAERKLRNARSVVVQAHPFFGALLLRQRVVEDPGCATIATDGDNLYFNPAYIEKLSPVELHFACAHEALHPGLCHHLRRGERDFALWNQACDYAINPLLVEARFTPPAGILLRDDLRGMSAEKIYAKLAEERRAARPDGTGEAQPSGPGEAEGDSQSGSGEGSGGDESAEPQDGDGQPGDDNLDPQGEGSQARQTRPDFGGTGCVLDGAKDEAERSAKEAEWRVAVSQAAMGAGTLPGGLDLAVSDLLQPRADWRDLLRRFMDQFSQTDYSWRAPNRRFVADGIYLPELRSESLPPIAFVIDASASMPSESLAQALSEVESIVGQLQPERLDVMVHDTAVREVRSFDPDEPVGEFRVQAGGGTLFAPTCDRINDNPEEYACVLWFTDMDPADWQAAAARQPLCPVLWIDYGDTKRAPSFGEDVVRMPRETA